MNRVPALLAAGAAVAGAGAVIAAGGSAQEPAGRTFTLFEREGSFNYVDNPPRQRGRQDQRVSVGDAFAFHVDLLDAGKKRVGRGDAFCVATQASRTFAGSHFTCSGTFRLPGGHLALNAAFRGSTGDRVVVAITGGTGAYEGARGTVASKPAGKFTQDTVHLLP